MKYKAILFDMDGVLIDSENLMCLSARQALEEFGVYAKPEDFLEFTGMGEDRYVGGVAEKYGVKYNPVMKERAYDHYGQQVAEKANVPQGVGQMLTELRSMGLVLAVCSAADLRKVRYNLQAIGVDEELFSALVTGSDVARKKPFPDIYLMGAEKIGMDPADCLVVEDAISGIQAAHSAGMDAVGVTSTFTVEQLTRDAQPEYLLDVVRALPELLKGNVSA